jgi:hypothetical protein
VLWAVYRMHKGREGVTPAPAAPLRA